MSQLPYPRRSTTPPEPRFAFLLGRLRLFGWAACGLVTCYALVNYVRAYTVSAVQQGGAAADACAWIVGSYVLARCVDALTRHFDGAAP